MSNVVEFHSRQNHRELLGVPANARSAFSAPAKTAVLRSSAKDTLHLLADQLELAMQQARAIEPRMGNRKVRQEFGDRIELVQRMLDIARVKILQL